MNTWDLGAILKVYTPILFHIFCIILPLPGKRVRSMIRFIHGNYPHHFSCIHFMYNVCCFAKLISTMASITSLLLSIGRDRYTLIIPRKEWFSMEVKRWTKCCDFQRIIEWKISSISNLLLLPAKGSQCSVLGVRMPSLFGQTLDKAIQRVTIAKYLSDFNNLLWLENKVISKTK